MKILITGNKDKKNFYKVVNDVFLYLKNIYNADVFVDILLKIKNNANNYKFLSIEKLNKKDDFIISIGGDGAILSLVRKMKKKQIPILGVHIGNLGFLNQSDKKNYKKDIDYIMNNNKITYLKYNILEAKFENKEGEYVEAFSLNDFVITQNQNVRLLKLAVYVDNLMLNKFNSDGMIFSTPLGSTAYSLSAGGPIVNPSVSSIIITPISAHRLSSRPIVITDKSKIKIKFPKNHPPTFLTSDGQEIYNLRDNSSIEIKKAFFFAKFIKISESDNYYEKLRTKLGW